MSKKTRNENQSSGHIDTATAILNNPVFTYNLAQEVITITTDKLKISLLENQEIIGKRNDWVAPLGILMSIVTTLLVSDFSHDALLGKENWKAIYIIMTPVSGVWFCKACFCAFQNRNKGSVDYLINTIKAKRERLSEKPIADKEAEL